MARLSPDGRLRAAARGGVLRKALDEAGRLPLRDWVEGVWLALGGPACLADEAAAEDVEVFLRLLQESVVVSVQLVSFLLYLSLSLLSFVLLFDLLFDPVLLL